MVPVLPLGVGGGSGSGFPTGCPVAGGAPASAVLHEEGPQRLRLQPAQRQEPPGAVRACRRPRLAGRGVGLGPPGPHRRGTPGQEESPQKARCSSRLGAPEGGVLRWDGVPGVGGDSRHSHPTCASLPVPTQGAAGGSSTAEGWGWALMSWLWGKRWEHCPFPGAGVVPGLSLGWGRLRTRCTVAPSLAAGRDRGGNGDRVCGGWGGDPRGQGLAEPQPHCSPGCGAAASSGVKLWGLWGPCHGTRALCLARAARLLRQPRFRALLGAPCQLCLFDPVLITRRKICF